MRTCISMSKDTMLVCPVPSQLFDIILQYAVVLTFLWIDNPLAMMTIFFQLDDHPLLLTFPS